MRGPRQGTLAGYRYRPPSPELLERYREIFARTSPLPVRAGKRIFDQAVSLAALVLTSPLWLLILLAMRVDGAVHPEHRGPLLAPYISATRGRKFLKYKFRVMTVAGMPGRLLRRHDYRLYPSEHEPANLTCVGRLLKKFYLDELPQAWNILRGEMSLVGPRALAWHHYQVGLQQGHVVRRLMTAGLFSETHVRKSTPEFPDATYEYDYAEKCARLPALGLLKCDLLTIARGFGMVSEGRGL